MKNFINYFEKNMMLLKLHKHNSILLLFILIVLSIVFETMSIGLIIPLFSSLSSGSFFDKFPELYEFFNSFSNIFWKDIKTLSMDQKILFTILIFFTLIFLLRNFFMLAVVWKKGQFEFKLKNSVSENLFSNYLKMPFAFHVKRNSAQLMRNVQAEVEIFSANIATAITTIGDVISILALFALLLFVEIKITLLVIFLVMFLSYLIYNFTKSRIKVLAEKRQFHAKKVLQNAKQSFDGIKEIKIFGREKEFTKNFLDSFKIIGWVTVLRSILYVLPRVSLELIIFLIVILFIIFSSIFKVSTNEMVPLLALYAGAAFRLMPYTNRLITGFQQLKFSVPSVNLLYDEYNLIKKNINKHNSNSNKIKFNDSLKISDLIFHYDEKIIFKNINLKIDFGTCFGLIGQSGCGKSTLIDLITGLRSPQKGTITVDGQEIKKDIRNWQNLIGYVPQQIFLLDDSIKKNIAFGLQKDLIDENKINESIDSSGLNGFVKDLKDGLDTMIGERGSKLSGGQIQRIGIARALYNNPSILILDESTSSLDFESEKKILDTLKKLKGKKTVIIVSHRSSTMQICDKIYQIKNKNLEEINSNIVNQ